MLASDSREGLYIFSIVEDNGNIGECVIVKPQL